MTPVAVGFDGRICETALAGKRHLKEVVDVEYSDVYDTLEQDVMQAYNGDRSR